MACPSVQQLVAPRPPRPPHHLGSPDSESAALYAGSQLPEHTQDCAVAGRYGVYTLAHRYAGWIESVMTGGASGCAECPCIGPASAVLQAQCAPGSAGVGAGACAPCEPGTAAAERGASACVPCGPGSFAPAAAALACAPCAPGTYQNRSGAKECVPCSPGSYAASPGSISCLPCPEAPPRSSGSACKHISDATPASAATQQGAAAEPATDSTDAEQAAVYSTVVQARSSSARIRTWPAGAAVAGYTFCVLAVGPNLMLSLSAA